MRNSPPLIDRKSLKYKSFIRIASKIAMNFLKINSGKRKSIQSWKESYMKINKVRKNSYLKLKTNIFY